MNHTLNPYVVEMHYFHPPIIFAQSINFIIAIFLQNCLSSFKLHKVKARHAATAIKFH